MNVALCKCGVDITDHYRVADEDHEFDAAGTRHRCTESVDGYLCPRPAYHQDENVPCGPLTGHKLW